MWYYTFFLTSNDSAPRNPQIYVSLCYRLTSWKPRLYATRWTPCGTKPSPTVGSQRKTCTARHSGKYLGFFFFTSIHPSLFCPAGQVFYKTFLISPINHRSLHPLISTFSFCLCSSFHRARRSVLPRPLIHPVYLPENRQRSCLLNRHNLSFPFSLSASLLPRPSYSDILRALRRPRVVFSFTDPLQRWRKLCFVCVWDLNFAAAGRWMDLS